jgi:cytochrome c
MNSFEFNKLAGGLLGALLFAMTLNIVSDGIFSQARPAKPGYDLPAQEEASAEAGTAAPAEPLPVLLAKADPKKGETLTKACQACHNFEKGAGPKVGPPLYGVLDRPKGSVPGFAYSDGMKDKGGKWTFDDLNSFISNPKTMVAGTKMAFAGEKDPQKRADIIDYLHTLSDSPEALPKIEPAAAPAAPAADKAETKPATGGK